jgi:hypothetical protein
MIILNKKLYFDIENHLKIDRSRIVNAGENLSDHIGFLAKKGDGSDNLTPIYPFSL